MKPGDVFSREKIVDSTKRITDRLGNDGYSFANVNPVPELDREKRVAGFTFFVDPGRRVYVRRVNVAGNQKTQDEVIRRELRQLESSWYSLEKIARSKERLQRTGYFQDVNIETPAVPGHHRPGRRERDRHRAQHRHSSTSAWATPRPRGLTIQASVSQANILGTGNLLAFQVNNGDVNKVYSFTLREPVLDRRRRLARLRLLPPRRGHLRRSRWPTTARTRPASGMRFGIPVTEYDGVQPRHHRRAHQARDRPSSARCATRHFVARVRREDATRCAPTSRSRATRATASSGPRAAG